MEKTIRTTNKFNKIYFAYQYANKHNIDPTNPETWDNNYKARMLELAGLLKVIEEEVKSLIKVLK
jgi:hypothetical protein